MTRLREPHDHLDTGSGVTIKESAHERRTREILDLKTKLECIQGGAGEKEKGKECGR